MSEEFLTAMDGILFCAYRLIFTVTSLTICNRFSFNILMNAVIFLPARPASQTHDSHKGRMIFNHESPAGRIKNCGEKSALSF